MFKLEFEFKFFLLFIYNTRYSMLKFGIFLNSIAIYLSN
jgi:hypothetical protein